jgi:methylene-fatty-acyl-phospholipid synthase
MDLQLLGMSAAALSAERLTYIWISCHPRRFVALVELSWFREWAPTDAVCALFIGFKLVQAAVFAAWFVVHAGGTLAPSWESPGAAALGIALIVAGQWLNARVFYLLGRVGAFYGAEFGRNVAWSSVFPFSVVAHPQYTGAVISIWGLFLLMRFPAPDWYVLPLLETFYYAAGARLECSSTGEPVGVSEPAAPADTAADVAAAR